MEVPGYCGHMGPNPECYQQAVADKVQQFLAQDTSPTPGMDRHVMTHGGIEREYFVHVPHNVQADKPLPVVLALHGYGTTATGFQAIYNLNQHADEQGYIVIYPQGTHFMGAFGTAPFNYMRVHGDRGYRGSLDESQLRKIKNSLNRQKGDESFVMFNNTFFDSRSKYCMSDGIKIKYAAVCNSIEFTNIV